MNRILLADDHGIFRTTAGILLREEYGIEVIGEAADGNEAVEMARVLRPDVVVMNLAMPGMDGIEATRRIKAEMPEVRVIGFSGYDEEDAEAAFLSAGAEAYISKSEPFRRHVSPFRTLAAAIRRSPEAAP